MECSENHLFLLQKVRCFLCRIASWEISLWGGGSWFKSCGRNYAIKVSQGLRYSQPNHTWHIFTISCWKYFEGENRVELQRHADTILRRWSVTFLTQTAIFSWNHCWVFSSHSAMIACIWVAVPSPRPQDAGARPKPPVFPTKIRFNPTTLFICNHICYLPKKQPKMQ